MRLKKLLSNLPKYYLSPTLLNAWLGGYDSFYDLLYRRKKELKQCLLDGIEFERKAVEGEIEELQELVKGALYQQFLCRECEGYMLLGYADLIKRDTIYDLKYVKSYDVGKYNGSSQHLIYLFCADMDKFTYIVGQGKDIYYEAQPRNDEKLRSIVRQFDNWLQQTGLIEVYQGNYSIERKRKEIEDAYKF